ncbi:MAG: DUF4347 domain-containing protein, partial [Planctomycetes bacterium]|nr:DUF4347 domain-containing protein [Planctomycetota bacterium]
MHDANREATGPRPMDAELLEDRVLFSAAPIDLEAMQAAEAIEPAEAIQKALDVLAAAPNAQNGFGTIPEPPDDIALGAEEVFDPNDAFAPSVALAEVVAREIVFIDRSVDDYQTLVADLESSSKADTFDLVFIDQNADGVEQITRTLAERGEYDAIHIVSHGNDRGVRLGETWLSGSTLGFFSDEISSWGQSLNESGDLLFYGCELADSSEGRALLESVSELCDCDVAASNDDTGQAVLGGDWDLEFEVGKVETQVAFSQDAQLEFSGLLATVTVDITADELDGDTSNIGNLIITPGGTGISLREAILAANNTGGSDNINFNIVGAGPHTINVLSASPAIVDTVIIDGWSEPDYVAGTPVIELNGVAAGAGVDGLKLNTGSSGSTIRGLIINRFTDDGIDIAGGSGGNTIAGNWIGLDNTGMLDFGNGNDGIEASGPNNIFGGTTVAERNVTSGNVSAGVKLTGATATGNVVIGNYIGTNANANAAVANGNFGLRISSGASGNTVGGLTAAERNIISGNTSEGVYITGLGTDNNVVVGNYIGTDPTGTSALGNLDDGVQIGTSANGNVIGGAVAGAGNVIAASGDDGIDLGGSTSNSVIQGNYIGVGSDGVTPLGNTSEGVTIAASANTQIGGTDALAGNVIANNGGDGVWISDATVQGTSILGNSIYANTGIGIDLAPNGVTANDVGDVDTGSNALQNFPVLTAAFTDASSTVAVSGTFNSLADTTFRLEFFANSDAADEGETYLGFRNVITDASGNTRFVGSFSAVVADAATITATATNLATGDTSEFSATRTTAATLVVDTTSDVVDGNTSSIANLLATRGTDTFISLREAIIATNNTVGTDGILLSSGTYGITLTGASEDLAASGDLDIRGDLVIAGAGAGVTTVTGNSNDRVFDILNSAVVDATGFSIIEGNASVDGGGVFVRSGTTLNLTDAIVSGNSASSGAGGGIANDGTLLLDSTRFTENSAAEGAGLENVGTAFITNSLFDTNTASSNGGGVQSKDGASNLQLVNVTLSRNMATTQGGGANLANAAALLNVTVANNSAGSGGGLYRGSGSVGLRNSILAGNTQAGGGDATGAFVSSGDNIIGDTTGSSGWGGGDQQNVDPLLAPLADYGGPTLTHALYARSPAEDAGNVAFTTLEIDQRGIARDDGSIDIGAFEGVLASNIVYVDTASDVSDGTTTSIAALVANKGADGFISLREAITATNNTANGGTPDEIHFNITGGGPHTIAVGATGLPNITDAIVIDGTTDPDFAGIPIIELDGTLAGGTADGLVITSGGSTIRGLVINRFGDKGIQLNSDNNTIVGNYIGTNVAGTAALGNGAEGIRIDANNNTIGGTTVADRNVISGNVDGVGIRSGTGNVVQGNFIGTNAAGTSAIANSDEGIELTSNSNTIGGATASQGNVISGNTDNGIQIGADSNIVQGNFIGTDLSGTLSLPNDHGVRILTGASNTIGGIGVGEANVIANNLRDGILLDTSAGTGNSLLGNSIHSNMQLGIDLNNDGADSNDPGDADTGPNNRQNFPVLTAAASAGSNTTIQGSLNSSASTTFDLHFYSSPTGDPSGNGEAEVYLGTDSVITDGSGNATINTTLVGVSVTLGHAVTATATDSTGNTSEFAPNVASVSNVLFVDTTSDVADGTTTSIAALLGDKGADGLISLREAILATNNTLNVGGPDEIHFNIAGAGPHTIVVDSTGLGALPNIDEAVIIDGTTESGASLGTLVTGTQHTLMIELQNDVLGAVHGITIGVGGTGSTIRGLVINNFSAGVRLLDGANTIEGNYIGTNVAGTAAMRNGFNGIYINNTAGNIVQNNLLSGNSDGADDEGVYVNGASATGNIVRGNIIGLNAAGDTALGNYTGVLIAGGANGNTIGGTAAGTGNLVSGNANNGIEVREVGSDNNVILGNIIGLNAAGTAAVANAANGILIASGNGTTIGGNSVVARNLISGNSQVGIDLLSTMGNVIQGNYIGTDITGSLDRGNTLTGIRMGDADNNTIGGSGAGEGNVISGNQDGLLIQSGSDNNIIQGNLIGTDATGTSGISNGGIGAIYIRGASTNNTIGGTANGEANTIAFNSNNGIRLDATAGTANRIRANSIHSNGLLGIDLNGNSAAETNDAGDGDTGPNDLQNYPVLTSSNRSGSDTTIQGSLNSAASTTFAIDFFSTPIADGSGFGEGTVYLGSANVATDGSGNATINETIVGVVVTAGHSVSATATDPSGNTSEFSAVVTAITKRLIVDTTDDVLDGDTSSIVALYGDKGADGFISLREAIIATNNTTNGGSPDEIHFNIVGAGPHSIQPTSVLPTITDAVIIDGTTEPDFATTPIVELDGSSLGAGGVGLQLDAGSSGSTIRGLVVNRFDSRDIFITGGSGGNLIAGNYLNTDVTGLIDQSTGGWGVDLINAGNGNIIGGSSVADRNVSAGRGVAINGASNTNTVITGNYFGVGSDGLTDLGSGDFTVLQLANAANTRIGGTAPGEGNIIANGATDGIEIWTGTSTILGNSIHGNAGLGIDLNNDGLTANDLGDADAGANNLQNFPMLEGAVSLAGNTTITGTLRSAASTTYRIEFYASPTGDASGHGEGQTYLGFTTVVTDINGEANFNPTLTGVSVTSGYAVSATATVDLGGGSYGDTSEFASNLLANSTAALTAGQDTYIQDSSGLNYGVAPSLIVDRSGGGLGDQRALLLFDLSFLPVGSTITNATLLMESTQNGSAMDINVYELTQAWSEGTGNGTLDAANWNERLTATNWTSAGGDFDPTAVATLNTGAIGQHSWVITGLVQDWYTGAKANNGIIIGSPNTGSDTVTYDSSEGATPPRLSLTYALTANTAPVLDVGQSPALAALNEDAGAPAGAVGTLVSSLVDFVLPAGQVDNVTDPDAGAALGIAVTAADTTDGTWHYSVDGGTAWNSLGSVANNSARRLAADVNTRIYFQPNADYNGTIANAITFRAWDQTSGTNGTLADTTTNGGMTSFSTATDTASLNVLAINDAPVVVVPGSALSAVEQTALSIHGTGFSVSDVDEGGSGATATLAVGEGAITVVEGDSGVTITAGNGTGSVALSGSIAQLDNLLTAGGTGTITYFNSSDDPSASTTFTVTVNDQGNTGADPGLTGDGTSEEGTNSQVINITAVVDHAVIDITTSDTPAGRTFSLDTLPAHKRADGFILLSPRTFSAHNTPQPRPPPPRALWFVVCGRRGGF